MTAKWGGIEMTAKNSNASDQKVNWVCDSGVTIHRMGYNGRDKVTSKQGGCWRVKLMLRMSLVWRVL